jgi:uncharacterized paraquat-inducible protein A
MIKTGDHYIGTDPQDMLCSSCKHIKDAMDGEPCKSCVITGYEPKTNVNKKSEKQP